MLACLVACLPACLSDSLPLNPAAAADDAVALASADAYSTNEDATIGSQALAFSEADAIALNGDANADADSISVSGDDDADLTRAISGSLAYAGASTRDLGVLVLWCLGVLGA